MPELKIDTPSLFPEPERRDKTSLSKGPTGAEQGKMGRNEPSDVKKWRDFKFVFPKRRIY
jgi:hypothetical protein